MTRNVLRAMVLNEARLRLRRASTQVLMLVAALLMWFMIVDPSSGLTMLSAGSARVIYNSTALALASSMLVTSLLGLFGFYLVRGRADEDLRSGMGSVLATTPVSNTSLIVGRWAGGVLYLSTLIVVLTATMCVLQAVRGEGAISPLVYLQFNVLTILPNIFFIAGMAVLCESYRPLMGKTGDVLYFLFWLAQITVAAVFCSMKLETVAPLAFDSTGIALLAQRGQQLLHTTSFTVGMNEFDPALPAVLLAGNFWTWPMVLTRFAAGFMAIIPLVIAVKQFHRFSPDKVSASTRRQWAIFAGVNRLLRPLDVFSRGMLRLSATLPRVLGQVAAELGLTFAASPLTGLLVLLSVAAGAVLDYAMLPWLLLAAVAYWGLVISELSVRDFKADTECMGSALPGGANQRYWRQSAAAIVLGLLLTASVMWRWAVDEPLRALCLGSGIVALAGLAQLLGRATRTGRTFTVLFLCGLYIATQAGPVAALDVLGMYGKATAASILQEFLVGIVLLAAGFGFTRWRAL
jgi:hypothetical protein